MNFLRKFISFAGAFILLAVLPKAQSHNYSLVRTAQNVTVNRNLPKNILPRGAAIPVTFSAIPTDREIFRVHFFEEPIIPINSDLSPGENVALVYALANYSQRKSPDDFSSLQGFLQNYPKSRWRGALLANLGLVYRMTGYYNQAMTAWDKSWELMKNASDPKAKVLADRVLSELLLLNAWVGRIDRIESLFDEIEDRVILGPAVAQIVAMRSALWRMKNDPKYSFKCGPYALNKIYTTKNPSHAPNEKLMNIKSTSKGFSLSHLEAMSREIGLNYQMAYRSPGAEIIANSVVHWKLGHYSVVLTADSGNVKCQDATIGTRYGQEFWLTKAAFDSSASGFFLVPSTFLPKSWRKIAENEGNNIFGKGDVPSDPGASTAPCDPQVPACEDCAILAMAQSNVHAASVSLHIYDRPLFYNPPIGPPVLFDVDYHHRDTYQPSNFNYSSLGPKWTFKWLSFIQDNPRNLSQDVHIYRMGGGYKTFNYSSNGAFTPELQSNDVLVRTCGNCYEVRHPDGSKEIYARPSGNTSTGRYIFLTEIVDAAGNTDSIKYDDFLRIVALKDAIGQVTTLSYENSADEFLITKVTDPFQRFASFEYDEQGRLIQIKDIIGITSSFQYAQDDFIQSMTTPYGTTSFIKEEGAHDYLSVETHFPMGEKERVEYKQEARGIPYRESLLPSTNSIGIFNNYINFRNTFFWDKKAMQEAPGDYTKAKIYHWLHGSEAINDFNHAAPILESTKEPLENRVWYNNQGQDRAGFTNKGMSAKPSIIGRRLDDGTSIFTKFSYNSLGKITGSIDPVGRKMSYAYDSTNINLVEIRQTTGGANELLAKYTYNNQQLPLTLTDASGLVTQFTYNNVGQLLTVTNPKNETTTYNYNDTGYLKSISGPVSGTTVNLSYDGFGRIRTVTDPEGYTITTDYDALNRPTIITYPDSTYEQIVYDRLDAVHFKDRMGRWSHTSYDSLGRADSIKDALGRLTRLVWCNCGSLAQIIDPLNHVTTFTHDLQGRLTEKIYHDGKKNTYEYEQTTSRLKSSTDAKGQKTQFSYFIDGNVQQISYLNALSPTGSVSFTYDPNYNRVATMSDTTGVTAYDYYPVQAIPFLGAGRLATVDGPLPNDIISYDYDSLGLNSSRSINGVSSLAEFDVLGRMTSATNALGNFVYSYINQTSRISTIRLPNGQSTVFDYFGNKGDQRLKQIWNKTAYGNTLSKFDYDYNAETQITKWTQQSAGNPPKVYQLDYDSANQLISVNQKDAQIPVSVNNNLYKYDSAGNLLMEKVKNTVSRSEYNSLNQLINKTKADILPHSTSLPIHGNSNPISNVISYDDNGNTISTTSPKATYEWDAADRLVKITQDSNITEFIYDGLSRRAVEKLNGVIVKLFLWAGTEIVEERDTTGSIIIKRFFPQGEQINGKPYYFTFDHLGSIREMTDSNGLVQTRYDYNPYGIRTKIFGKIDSDFGFAGYYYHVTSDLYLTLFRAYDANLKGWLSRDPMGEGGGMNLYRYVENNPINIIDHYGLAPLSSKECTDRLETITRRSEELLYKLSKYDPVRDAVGGDLYFYGTKKTKPFSHYKDIIARQKGLKKNIEEYHTKCYCPRKDSDDDDPPLLPVSEEIKELVDQPVPEPPGYPGESAPIMPITPPFPPRIPFPPKAPVPVEPIRPPIGPRIPIIRFPIPIL